MEAKGGHTLPSGVTASITVVDGPDRGRLKKLRSVRTVIGRKGGDLLLRDSKISSEHAAIEFKDGKFMVQDLNSTNGTFVNDERVNEKTLKHLDEIKVGFSTLLFRVSLKSKAKGSKSNAGEESSQVSDISQTDIDSLNSVPPVSAATAKAAATSEKKEVTVQIIGGPHRGTKLKTQKENLIIGRVNSDIALKDDKDVSRKHAVIELLAGDQLFIRDLASTNGTFVNEARIANSKLKDGDEIRIGNSILKITFDN